MLSKLCLLVFSLMLTSCIVTYRDFPAVDRLADPLPKKDFTFYYSLSQKWQDVIGPRVVAYTFPALYPLVTTQAGYQEVEWVFNDVQVFRETRPVSTPPEKGVYCSVWLTILPIKKKQAESEGAAQQGAAAAAGLSLALFPPLALAGALEVVAAPIPFYSTKAGYVVHYDLYVDSGLKKSYSYRIVKKGVSWIALLPFTWVNFLTYSEKDAFRATAYQFLIDAEGDGYLK